MNKPDETIFVRLIALNASLALSFALSSATPAFAAPPARVSGAPAKTPPAAQARASRAPASTNARSAAQTQKPSRLPASTPQRHITSLPPKVTFKDPARENKKGLVRSGNVANVNGFVRAVRAIDSGSSGTIGETTAVAFADNVYILSLDFVSDLNLARTGVRYFVDERANRTTELFLVDVDLGSGLAAFKSSPGSASGASLTTSQIRQGEPQSGEALTSVASADGSRNEVRFVKAMSDGTLSHYRLDLGYGRDSSNFVFDHANQLVAIAGLPDKDGSVWAASSRAIDLLVKRASAMGPVQATSNVGFEARKRQLNVWQITWARALDATKQGYSLKYLECQPFQTTISDVKLASAVQRFDAKQCESRFAMALGGGYEASLKVQLGEAFLKPSRYPVRREEQIVNLSEAFAASEFQNFQRQTASVNLLTAPECRDQSVMNSAGQRVSVHFCTSALKGEMALNDTTIAVSNLDGSYPGGGAHAWFTTVRLKGFGQAQTRSILEAVVENPRGSQSK